MAYRFNPFNNQFEQESNTFNSDEILAYVNNRINDILGGVNAEFDTLREVANALGNDPSFLPTLQAHIATLSGQFSAPISGIVQEFMDGVESSSGGAGVATASGILTSLVNQVAAKADANVTLLSEIQAYFLDSALATHGDLHVDHVTIGTSAAADYSPRSSVDGQLIP